MSVKFSIATVLVILAFFAMFSVYKSATEIQNLTISSSTPKSINATDRSSGASVSKEPPSKNSPPGVDSSETSAPTTSPSVTDVFYGEIGDQVGSASMNGKSAVQYQINIKADPNSSAKHKGNASGRVIASFYTDSLVQPGKITNPIRLQTHYNSQTNWYEVISASVVFTDYQPAADFSNDRILVGASHDVFVGKVLKEIGVSDRGIGPETQFEVQVVDNVKGELRGTVVVDQQGGYLDGTLYIADGDMSANSKGQIDYLLQPGSTYLMAVRYSPFQGWLMLNPYPTASKLISSDPNASEASLRGISEADTQVQALKAAYPNEVLLDADVKHGNTLNSYRSVQVQKAAAAAATAN